jgi:hypothetical protein
MFWRLGDKMAPWGALQGMLCEEGPHQIKCFLDIKKQHVNQFQTYR